jgi:hypothetical protein
VVAVIVLIATIVIGLGLRSPRPEVAEIVTAGGVD